MVMGAEVFTQEANLEPGFISMWFQFPDAESAGLFSTMTCTVEYTTGNEYANPSQVHISEYHGQQLFSETENIGNWQNMFPDKPDMQVDTPLWVVLAEGQEIA